MKAVVLYGPHHVEIGELPSSPLQAGDVRVKVSYCGICGSDYHKLQGKQNTRPVTYPVALGHEISGIVSEVGENVTEFAVGDRVVVDPNWSCGECYYCKNGKSWLCERSRGVVKGMKETVDAPQKNVYHLPDSLSLCNAALAEPVACCLRGLDRLGLRAGERVALVGFGAIGAIMLNLLKNAGAGEIAVIECNEARRALALEMGATVFFNCGEQIKIDEYAQNNPIDCVIECVGNSSAQQTALSVAGKGATVVMFGVSDADERISLSMYDAFIKELTIRTSYINPHTTERAIRLLASGTVDTQKIISRVISMEEAVDEFRFPHYSREGKVLVQINCSDHEFI